MKSVKLLLYNALVGLVLLVLANMIGLGVEISIITLLICAILGVPGALIVIVLALLDVAFMATIVATPLL